MKFSLIGVPKKVLKFKCEGLMLFANSGPIQAKNELNPSAISIDPVIKAPFSLK